ncbi:MAG: hypothetical protein ABSE99_12090 [Terracidiphilus sp.]|jgi:hypothetical protein
MTKLLAMKADAGFVCLRERGTENRPEGRPAALLAWQCESAITQNGY